MSTIALSLSEQTGHRHRHSVPADVFEKLDGFQASDLRPTLPVRNLITVVVRRDNEKGLIVEAMRPQRDEEPNDVAAATPKARRQSRPVPIRRARSGPSRAINPVLGAALANTDPDAGPAEYNGLAHYVAQTMLTNLLDGERERRAWFELFREYRTLFHSFHYAAAVHIDLLRNEISKSSKERALVHKGAAMSMLKRGLNRLSTSNVDVLLIVMVTLATHDLTEKTMNPGPAMGFRPHEPLAYWMSAYGRLETIKEHLEAIAKLVMFIGGLSEVQLPGLGNCLAVTDLMVAGTNFGPPTFANYWEPHPAIIAQHNSLLSSHGNSAGRGFFTRIPCGLPAKSLAVFVRLATVDRYMAENSGHYETDEAYRRMMNTRNAVHHSVLSLLPWDMLDDVERRSTSSAVYECCRTAAVLYSCAVLYGLPHHLNWQARPVEHLQELVASGRHELREAPEVLLWTLCIGALATLSSHGRAFFDRNLAELCEQGDGTYRWSFAECRVIVEDFLWSRRACGDGAAIVWAALLETPESGRKLKETAI